MTTRNDTPDEKSVSDALLESFDTVVSSGDTLPLEELKKRYADSQHFAGSYGQSRIYKDVAEVPVTVEMFENDDAREGIALVLAGMRKVYGDGLMTVFSSMGSSVWLVCRVWEDEAQLRKLWREFAEHEYKSENLGGAS